MKIQVRVTIDGHSYEAEAVPRSDQRGGYRFVTLERVKRAMNKAAREALEKYLQNHWG